MKITKVIYVEQSELPDYHLLDNLYVIHFTEYNTNEIDLDSINDGFENYHGSREQYIDMIINNIGSDVYNALCNKEVDIIMVV